MPAERLDWIDRLRGIGIVLVVLGHNPWLKNHQLHAAIYLFHMPLFFYAAGLVHKEVPLTRYLRSRLRALLVPYLVCGVLFSLIAAKLDWRALIANLIGVIAGVGDLMPQPHIWFLPCLFLVGIAQLVTLRNTSEMRTPRLLVILLVLLIFAQTSRYAMPGIEIDRDTVTYRALPWSLDLVPVGLAFFAFGITVRRRYLHLVGSSAHHPVWILVLAALVAAIGWYASGLGLMVLDLNHRLIEGVGTLPFAVVCVLVVSGLCVLIRGKAGSALEYIGQRSLVIFLFHYYVQSRISTRIDGFGGAMVGFSCGLIVPLALDFAIRKYAVLEWIFYPKKTT
ncbi:acyltransferase family protein [Pelomonas sp. Root1237]|uniref:acyltransferase family protein n=1 Tax=Pelomonas sp. Root1237 TaxID=1736434 RepID=UPI000AD5EF0B|nr:acyltransferase family protein [Pelomonas sp. Root1237]